VGDVAGFAASTLLRGVSFAQIPSTLLAMVDSSVGGKTGIDRLEGKNLVGTIQQPRFVLCDVELLETLPIRERRAGLAEVVKSAVLSGESALAALERDVDALARGDEGAILRAIHMSIGLKADIVAADEHETRGLRLRLNLGHTVGHALEAQSGYALRHGEAVGLGLLAAARVSERLGFATAALGQRIAALLEAFGLPVDLDAHLCTETWIWMRSDKKRAGDVVRFLVPVAPGDVRVVALAAGDVARLVQP
jgi:3-dehydroquinate synthetase